MAAIARMVVVARRVRMKVLVRRSIDACAILVLYCERWRLQALGEARRAVGCNTLRWPAITRGSARSWLLVYVRRVTICETIVAHAYSAACQVLLACLLVFYMPLANHAVRPWLCLGATLAAKILLGL